MKINIITRCTRLGNIETVKESIFKNLNKNIEVEWHIVFDTRSLKDIDAELLNRLNVNYTKLHFMKGDGWGLSQLNGLISELKGWIYHLDDDNILHENFYNEIEKSYSENKRVKAFIFSQKVGGKDFSKLDTRQANPENVKISKIDLAQWLIHSDLHINYKYGSGYVADGEFIEKLYENEANHFVFINKILCYYNFLEKQASPKVPKVLYIGPGKPDLKSVKLLSYESDELNVYYLEDDTEVASVLAKFDPDSIITIGESWMKFPNMAAMPLQYRRKWVNIPEETYNLKSAGDTAYNVAMNAILDPTTLNDGNMISFYTPIYNTGSKLLETYKSVAEQTYPNWEWVLVNDSTDGGKTLKIAEAIAKQDPRVKVFDFREKSGGCIGEVKWRACAMSKGYILAELDHDDLLAITCAEDLHKAAQAHPECGMFYGDTAEVTENWENHTYEPGFALGYGNYRTEEYMGKTLKPANQQNINPKTIRHIVGVPNHIRAWRRSTYFEIGGHNRNLTIADDYELVVRTFLKSKICRIPKLTYIQFLYNNASGRNTHDLSRADIQRRVRTIAAHYDEQIKARFEELGIHDWAYAEYPAYPIMAESRFGEAEGVANIIYNENI